MEHFNPILGNDTTGQKFITCGEIMLRLTPAELREDPYGIRL